MHEEAEQFARNLGPAARHAIAARVRRGKEGGALPGWALFGSGAAWGPEELARIIALIEEGITRGRDPHWSLVVMRGDGEDPLDYVLFALKNGEESSINRIDWSLAVVPRQDFSEETRITIADLIEQGHSQGEEPHWILRASSLRR